VKQVLLFLILTTSIIAQASAESTAAAALPVAESLQRVLLLCQGQVIGTEVSCPRAQRIEAPGTSLLGQQLGLEEVLHLKLRSASFEQAALLLASRLEPQERGESVPAIALKRTHRFLDSFIYNAMIGGYVAMTDEAQGTVVLIHPLKGDAYIFAHGGKSF
jgi:hypothetical protein